MFLDNAWSPNKFKVPDTNKIPNRKNNNSILVNILRILTSWYCTAFLIYWTCKLKHSIIGSKQSTNVIFLLYLRLTESSFNDMLRSFTFCNSISMCTATLTFWSSTRQFSSRFPICFPYSKLITSSVITQTAHHTAHKPRPGSIQGPSRPADITNLQFTSKSD